MAFNFAAFLQPMGQGIAQAGGTIGAGLQHNQDEEDKKKKEQLQAMLAMAQLKNFDQENQVKQAEIDKTNQGLAQNKNVMDILGKFPAQQQAAQETTKSWNDIGADNLPPASPEQAALNVNTQSVAGMNNPLEFISQQHPELMGAPQVKGMMELRNQDMEYQGKQLDRLLKAQDYELKRDEMKNKLKELPPELKGTVEKIQGTTSTEITQFGNEVDGPMDRITIAFKSQSPKADPLLAMQVAKMYNPNARINDDGTFSDTEGIPHQVLGLLLKSAKGNSLLLVERIELYNLSTDLYNTRLTGLNALIQGNIIHMASKGVMKDYLDFPIPYAKKYKADRAGNVPDENGPPSGRKY